VPFVSYAADWGFAYPGWFASCAKTIFDFNCYGKPGQLACNCLSNIVANLNELDTAPRLRHGGCANWDGCRRCVKHKTGTPVKICWGSERGTINPGPGGAFTVYRDAFTSIGANTCRFLAERFAGPPCLDPIVAKQRACDLVAARDPDATRGGLFYRKFYWRRACTPGYNELVEATREQMVCSSPVWNCSTDIAAAAPRVGPIDHQRPQTPRGSHPRGSRVPPGPAHSMLGGGGVPPHRARLPPNLGAR